MNIYIYTYIYIYIGCSAVWASRRQRGAAGAIEIYIQAEVRDKPMARASADRARQPCNRQVIAYGGKKSNIYIYILYV